MPSLGVTGVAKVRNAIKGRAEDGTIKNGLKVTQAGFVQNDADELIRLNDGYVNNAGTVVGSVDTMNQYSQWRYSDVWSSRSWYLRVTNYNNIGIETRKWDNSSGWRDVRTPFPNGNAKYHVASSFKANGELALYVDGTKTGSTPYGITETQQGRSAYFAGYADQVAGQPDWLGPYLFGGVLLFDRVLTEAEIKQLYINSSAPFVRKQRSVFFVPEVPPTTQYNAFATHAFNPLLQQRLR